MSSKNVFKKFELRLLGADCAGELDYLVHTDPGPAPGHPGHDGDQHPGPDIMWSVTLIGYQTRQTNVRIGSVSNINEFVHLDIDCHKCFNFHVAMINFNY